ncbi:hypothetical protein [Aureimonas leprariae]|uniref:hypothetical protein n=1 Tax=Plantimonas leprariae TaxID=2615207 RepID=UPI0012482C92|nr:hypothetical protein [Aureimonas leprariae]
MPVIDIDTGPEVTEIRRLLSSRRREDAVAAAQQHLRNGYSSRDFLRLVADLLEPPRKGKRGPKPSPPALWMERGEAVERLRSEGMTYEKAIDRVAFEMGSSPSTIGRACRYYNEALDEHSRLAREEQ